MKLQLPKRLLGAVMACYAIGSFVTAETFNTNQIFDTSGSFSEDTIIGSNLVFDIKEGVVITQESGGFNIGNKDFTLTGGGTLVINTTATSTIGSGTISEAGTVTVTNNSTLDLTNGKLNNDAYTRKKFSFTNGGRLIVSEYGYAAMGAMANHWDYWTFNGGILELAHSLITTGETPRNAELSTGILATGDGARIINDTTDGVVQLRWDVTNRLQVNSKVIFDGAGSYATNLANAAAIQGSGTIVKTGSGSLILNSAISGDSSFNGIWELNQGTLAVNHAEGLGRSTTLNVTGNSHLSGLSTGLQKNITVSDNVSLDISGVTGGLSLSTATGSITLRTGSSLTGSLSLSGGAKGTLGNNASITGNVTVGTTGSLVFVDNGRITGNLTMSGGSLKMTAASIGADTTLVSGSVNFSGTNTLVLDLSNGLFDVGAMVLGANQTIAAGTIVNLDQNSANLYNLNIQDNQLVLSYKDNIRVWSGNDGNVWSSGCTGWNNDPALTYADTNQVYFNEGGIVNIQGTLTPNSITFSGAADKVLTLQASEGSGLAGSGQMNVSGKGTLILNSANTGYSGQVWINNGTLVLNNANALGTGKLVWNGGLVRLGDDLTANLDLSSKMEGADDSRNNVIKLDTNGHDTIWNTGRNQFAYEKYGQGNLKLNFAGTFAKNFTIYEGSITFVGANNLNGILAGSGDIINESGNLCIKNANNTFNGTIFVNGGNVFLGNNNTTGSGAASTLGSGSKVVINSGTNFYINLTGGSENSAGTGKSLSTDFFIKSGGGLRNVDNNIDLNGKIHFNVAEYNPNGEVTYNSAGEVTLHQYWAKYVVIKGQVAGSGIVNVLDGTSDANKDHRYVLRNTSNTFDGTYKINGAHKLSMELAVSDKLDADGNVIGGVAKDASFELLTDKSSLYISGDQVTIAGLSGVAGSNLAALGGGVKTLIVDSNADSSFLGTWGANLNLTKKGSGTLTLGSFGGSEMTIAGGGVDLGSIALSDKTITLVEGNLLNANGLTNSQILIDNTASAGANTLGSVISLGGASGQLISSFKSSVSANGTDVTRVTGIGNGNLTLRGENGAQTLHFSSDMIGSNSNPASNQIFSYGDGQTGNVALGDGSNLTITIGLTGGAVDELLKQAAADVLLKVTNGTLSLANGTKFDFETQYNILGAIFDLKGNHSVSNGSIVLESKGDVAHSGWVYLTSGETLNVTNADLLDKALGIFNNGTINLSQITGSVNLNNLEGSLAAGTINAGNANLNINLINTAGITQSVYQGKIDAVNSVLTKKSLAGTNYDLSILGGVKVQSIDVESGKLTLGGVSNISQALNVATGSTFGLAKQAIASVGSLGTGNGQIDLAQDSRLVVGSDIVLNHSVLGLGSLVVSSGHTFELGNQGSMSNQTTLEMNGSMNGSGQTLGALSGTGVVSLDANSEFTLSSGKGVNSVYKGQWNIANGQTAKVIISGEGTQGLQGAGSSALNLEVLNGSLSLAGGADGKSTYKSLVVNGGNLSVMAPSMMSKQSSIVNSTIHFTDSVQFSNNSTWTVGINSTDYSEFVGPYLTSDGQISMEDTNIKFVNQGGSMKLPTVDHLELVLAEGSDIKLGDNVTFDAGIFSGYFKDLELVVVDGNQLVIKGGENTENIFRAAALSYNSQAGSDLLWNAKAASANGGTLQSLFMEVSSMISHNQISEASHVLAAAAGSSLTSISIAQRDALRDQMGWLRNRMVYMGAEQSVLNADMPYFNMWVQGTGSYNKLKQQGHDSGYSLSTWGGTVGADLTFSDRLSAGVAFATQFGNLDAHAPDMGSGDLDGYYLNAFAKYQKRAWTHNFMVTGSWNHSKFRRTVAYNDLAYSAHSSSNGYGIGAMYELNYTYQINESAKDILQPLLNIALYHTSMDGFDESGADNAGLRVGNQDMTTATVSLGGRWIGEIGTNLFGREALGEFRVNVAQDMGDNRAKANVAFLGNSGYTQQIRGVKEGSTALQVGAGIQMPLGELSSIFIDANADFRNGANSVNGSIGYRYNF